MKNNTEMKVSTVDIGDKVTIKGITGKVVRWKDENIVSLFDGQEIIDVSIEPEDKECTGCNLSKPQGQFRTFKSGRVSNRCDTCRAKGRNDVTDTMQFQDILDEKADLHLRKNADYGNSFDVLMNEFGMTTLIIHLTEKLNRIKQLAGNEALVKGESMEDSLIDLSNYADMGLLWLRRQEDPKNEK